MRRHRGDVLVARFSGPHDRNHGLVTHGHIHGDDHWFSCHGLRQHFLGHGDGSLRAAEGGARWLLSVGGESGAGGVQPLTVRIPSGVWFAGRHWNVRDFCADDGHGDRMVRYSKKSGGVVGLGGYRKGCRLPLFPPPRCPSPLRKASSGANFSLASPSFFTFLLPSSCSSAPPCGGGWCWSAS